MKLIKNLNLYVFLAVFLSIHCKNTTSVKTDNKVGTATQLTENSSGFSDTTNKPFKMRGLSFVAPPRPFSQTPMMDVKAVKADWIAVIPYGYTKIGEPKVHYESDKADWQWWGERREGVSITIDSAHRVGLNVMLKPQVYVPNGWTGTIDYQTEYEWEQWEQSYERYILPFIDIAQSTKVAMVCVGTEFKIGVVKREKILAQLNQKIRQKYQGKLVYAANWDEYPLVPFWDALDYVGVNAYFPLVPGETPSVSDLQTAWQPHFDALRSFQQKCQKPMLFTEFGYLSVDGCAYNSWEVEKRIHSVKINEQAQANALDGLFSTFWKEHWWAGGFLWKWFPEGQGHEGYIEKDYTPQGKKAETVLKKWYSQ